MKKFVLIPILFMFLTMFSCTASNVSSSKATVALLEGQEFTFMAERASPTNYDVINTMNGMRNTSASRMLSLDYGYTLVIKKEEIEVTLPYFGRLYSGGYDNAKNSYRFTSKDFELNKIESRKSSTVFTIRPKDVHSVQRIIMEVYKNGRAFVSIDSNDRQPISYDGYILKNQEDTSLSK